MELLTPSPGLLVWTLLAFLIVFFILKKYAWTAIIKGLSDREKNIASSIASAERIKLEMAQLKNDNEAFLVKAREERAILLKEAKEIKDKLISDAREEAKAQAAKNCCRCTGYHQSSKNGSHYGSKKPGGSFSVRNK